MYLYYILVQFMNWNWKMVVFDNFSFICNNLNRSCDMREINIGPSVNCGPPSSSSRNTVTNY